MNKKIISYVALAIAIISLLICIFNFFSCISNFNLEPSRITFIIFSFIFFTVGITLYFFFTPIQIKNNNNDNTIIKTDNNDTNINPIEKPTYKPIDYNMLNADGVIHRYLSTDHIRTPSEYNHYEYFKAEFDCMLNNLNKISINLSDEKIYRQKEIDFLYEKSKNITVRSKISKIKDFIAIDTETTGLKTSGNDIIEISAIKFENFIPTEIFTTLLKPRKPIPKTITDINGITDEMVINKPKFNQIHNSLVEFLSDYPLVMHNAKFDLKFLFISGLDLDYENLNVYDTLELSRKCIKDYDDAPLDNYKLETVCNEMCIYFNNAHRSSADALATGLLFNEIVKIKRNIQDLSKSDFY
jgi:DNA polymerase-3 subunit epsilon/DNA polymerase-3 subunit alpha (Gram-positive type)